MAPQIIIFASGEGSNAKRLFAYSKENNAYQIAAIVCNNADAGVVKWAKQENITVLMANSALLQDDFFCNQLVALRPALIVLAGYLQKIPVSFIELFHNQIINIHPSLLPKHGGKGMYGMHVHNAVLASKDTQTGITIHYVNGHYDEGKIIAQFTTAIAHSDSAHSIAQKVQALEHHHLCRVVETLCTKNKIAS